MKKVCARFALVAFVFVGSPAIATPLVASAQNPSSTKVGESEADRIVARMSLKQKVGQLMILGFSGQKFAGRLSHAITHLQPGAIIVFRRNIVSPQQISLMNQQAQKLATKVSGVPLLIMVDQEGGNVTRIPSDPSPPSALALGFAGSAKLSQSAGEVTGKILRTLGFNMNLAPVVDLSDPYLPNFVGNRSFGQDPEMVNEMAFNYATGLVKSGVLPTMKHYPGHGGIMQDSHRLLPKKMDTFPELVNGDLLPFRFIADSTLPSAMMVAHVAYPNVDPSQMPATFSPRLVTELLKNRLGYTGLVISDDLEMSGAQGVGNVGERAIRAIEAGVDMVMIAWSPQQQLAAQQSLLRAVKSQRIPVEKLDEIVKKIVMTKLKMNLFDKSLSPSLEPSVMDQLSQSLAEMKHLSHQIAYLNFKRSIRGFWFLQGHLNSEQPLIVFSADPRVFTAIKELGPRPLQFVRLAKGRKVDIDAIMKKNPRALGIFYASGVGTAKTVSQLQESTKLRMFVVNTTYPGTIPNTHHYLAVVNINTPNFLAGRWAAEFLSNAKGEDTFAAEVRTPASADSTDAFDN